MVDPEAPAGAVISALGIERDGFRGNWLAVNVSMLVPVTEAAAAAGGEESEEETGWAGVYAAHFVDDDGRTVSTQSCSDDARRPGACGIFRFRRPLRFDAARLERFFS